MLINFRFKISFLYNDQLAEVGLVPLFGDGKTFEEKMEANEVFYRGQLNGKLLIQNPAFGFIESADIETQFIVDLQVRENNAWVDLWQGEFFKSDCDFDLDTKSLEVQPTTIDIYQKILDDAQKEIDLSKKAMTEVDVSFLVEPIVQIYLRNDEYVTNFIGNLRWEQPVGATPNPGNSFTSSGFLYMIPTHSSLPAGVAGEYLFDGTNYDNVGSDYRIFFDIGGNVWRLVDIVTPANPTFTGPAHANGISAVVFTDDATGLIQCQLSLNGEIYIRLLTGLTEINGNQTTAIDGTDIIEATQYYKYHYPIITDNFIVSDVLDSTPDIYGRADTNCFNVDDNQQYFHKPINTEFLYPIGKPHWDCVSIWFHFDATLRQLHEDATETKTVTGAYLLNDVVSAMLDEIDPNITFTENSDASEFYNGLNPIDNENYRVILIPLAKIIKGDYDQAAYKLNLSWQDLTQALWTAHRVKWHIDTNNELHLEHISYYERGRSYTDNQYTIDTSIYTDPHTEKRWEYGQNKYGYKKQDMPERIRTKWRNTGSFPFEGLDIEVLSRFVQKGNTKTESASRFDTDLIFAMTNGFSTSNDDSFLMVVTNEFNTVRFKEITYEGETFNLQNGFLSNLYLHDNFYRHSMPALNLKINGIETTATTVKRTKTQSITVSGAEAVEPEKLVSTTLGAGQIESTTRDLTNGQKRINILHDTQ